MNLLQIYYESVSEKSLKIWLTFGEVMDKSLVSCFSDSQCIDESQHVAHSHFCNKMLTG